MRFAGRVWRLLVGIKDGLVLLFMLLFFFALFAILTARPSPADVRDGALLLDLDGVIVEERTPVDPFAALLTGSAPISEYQSRDLVRAIDAAARDDRIKAVVLDLDGFLGAGQVHLAEVGEALTRVRAADKPVLAYATAYGDDGVFLAAHASEVWVNPLGGAIVAGPGGDRLYFADLLERLKINARVYKVGTYKSAVEPFTQSSMSDPARENAQALIGALWEEWQAKVKKARPAADLDMIVAQPAEWVEAAGGDLATAARNAGLVDTIGDRVAFGKRVAELVGEDEWDDMPGTFAATELDAWLEENPLVTEDRAIGVVTIAGSIVDGDSQPGTAGGDRIARLLDEALERDLAGLVVRVDSPGGSALASEQIRNAIERHKARDIPIAVSMANYAASGGYWVATPADRIFAEPETITGSIGIFAMIPTFERAAADIGVNSAGVATGPLSGQPDIIGGFTPEVDRILQSTIEDGYEDFLSRVAASRNMTRDQVDTIGQGRVWDGGTARQLRLVDEYGGLEDALAWVAGQADLGDDSWSPIYLGADESTTDTILRQLLIGDQEAGQRDMFAYLAQRQQMAAATALMEAQTMLGTKGAQAYCLGCPAPVASRAQASQKLDGFFARMFALLTD